MGEVAGESISDVKVTRLSETRAASLQLLSPSRNVQLSIWETANVGRQITRLGSSPLKPTETVLDMAVDDLSPSRVVGALRLTDNTFRLSVWDISDDGTGVTNRWSMNGGGNREVAVTALSSSRFATGMRSAEGNLQVTVWSVSNTGIHALATATGGAATSICITKLSSSRVAISLRTDQGALKVIVWDLIDSGGGFFELERRGEATGVNISHVAATSNAGGKWVTAFRTSPGKRLELARWSVSTNAMDEMTLTPELVTLAHGVQDAPLALAPGRGKAGTVHAASASLLPDGTFKINAWGDETDDGLTTYEFSAENTDVAVSTVSLDEMADTEYFVGTRTPLGALKMMTWHWAGGGGNLVITLQGDCRVAYFHFQDGSVNTNILYPGATFGAGQILGRMGNSGSSSGPHTHIDSARIFPVTTLPEMIELEASGDLPLMGSRPMPFTGAKAMLLSDIEHGGEDNRANSFATLDGEGMYDDVLGIRPRINTRYLDRTSTSQSPTGRKDVVLGTGSPAGGPFRGTVAQAVSAVSAGTRLYVRGGNYTESIVLKKAMTIRRYDYYDTAGSVVIDP
jgi:hypothetical protein